MRVVNGRENEVVDMLGDFGLSGYEARMYFTLLTIGEAKATEVTRKASVPQSRSYDVLDALIAKGFVEMTRSERPKLYRAKVLEEAADLVARRKQREVQELYRSKERLQSILLAIKPMHEKYGGLRLFTPSYQRPKKGGD